MAGTRGKTTKAPKVPKTHAGARRRRKPAGASTGLPATELASRADGEKPSAVAELCEAISTDGGAVLASYREPYGGRWLLLAALPIERVAATPYQRNLSDTHVRKLEMVISKLGRFLDPIIVVRAPGEGGVHYWTPNGHHRLAAMRTLGAKSITAIVVPEPAAAYQILALNTEKAHNLRERALEVIRMYRELARLDQVTEEHYALEFEEPALITLGLCYEAQPRFSGGAYHPILKRCDQFINKPLHDAMAIREARAGAVRALDEQVSRHVEALKQKGLTSPYLRSFVVARLNPIRFRPKEAEPLGFDEVMDRMTKAAARFNPEKIKMDDLAKTGGAPEGME
ncbi:MAG: ParB N-terminal domain-containing protein [Nitrospirae bacterium]|nr:ParB N-terminal domain-containing protein [Nitrospirota bacterium]